MTDTIATSAAPGRVNLLGMTRAQLEAFFLELGEKRFRAEQVMKWMHHQGITDFAQMSNLGKALREKLQRQAEIRRIHGTQVAHYLPQVGQ